MSTGVLNDIRIVGEIYIVLTNAVLIVNAISGLAGQEFRMDKWRIDMACSYVSQKGFILVPKLTFIT